MTAIRHVFLDLDGTLTNPAPGIVASYLHAANSMGRDQWRASDLERYIGPPLREALAEILETVDSDVIEQGVTHYREYFAVRGLLENALYPGAIECLTDLRAAGMVPCLATSKPTTFAERIAHHFGLSEHLHGIYGSELGGSRSDKPALIAHALDHERADSGASVMVGDRRHDIEGANANAMPSIGVLWGFGSPQELAAAKPARLVIDIVDLADVVEELSRSLAADAK